MMTRAEAIDLFRSDDLIGIGMAADAVRRNLHPHGVVSYIIDRNINYTNVCAAVCDFCAFYRKSGDEDAYVLGREALYEKFRETLALGGDQVLMQGGMHPSLKLEWYEELLRDLRQKFPAVNLHAFSPPEIWHFSKVNKLPVPEVLRRLNLLGPTPPGLAGTVLATNPVGRGQQALPLLGAPVAFGPQPVDPAEVPTAELLRVALGALAVGLLLKSAARRRA